MRATRRQLAAFLLGFLCSGLWALAANPSFSPQPAPRADLVTKTMPLPDGGSPIWYVDVRGNDANTCTGPFTDGGMTGPCVTILGAGKKIPKIVRHPVTISLATGNYAGAWLAGFIFDPVDAATGAYILLQGPALGNFSPATGTATGTVSSAAACATGPNLVEATFTVSGQTWTSDNLKGQLVETTGGTGSGQILPISGNTSTVATLAGCWGTTPDATTTYAIRDWGAVINSTTNLPPNFKSSAGNAIGLGFFNMQDSIRNNNAAAVYVDRLRVNVSTTTAALLVTNANVYAQSSRFDSSSSGPGVSVQGGTRLNFQQSIATSSTGQALLENAYESNQTLRLLNSYFESASTTNPVVALSGSGFAESISNNTTRATSASSPRVLFVQNWAAGIDFQGMRLKCTAGGSTVGLQAETANNSTPFFPNGPVGLAFEKGLISECPTAVKASGPGVFFTVDKTTLQATAGTTAIEIDHGATVNLDTISAVSGSFTNQVVMDNGLITAALADFSSGFCVASSSTGSRACIP